MHGVESAGLTPHWEKERCEASNSLTHKRRPRGLHPWGMYPTCQDVPFALPAVLEEGCARCQPPCCCT